tara:strand:+ start:49 stop:1056 length:1008 start_codon:yes stop_codon:yes gene_type:complete
MVPKVKERLENIDLLRGVAIIFVVLFHYTNHYSPDYLLRTDNWFLPIAKYGWSGVDIFFIVSGYCIALTIIKTSNFVEFSVKRFARIYPAYFFCGISTLIFFSFFDLPGREVSWFTGFMNLIFANFIPGLNFKYIDGIYWALIVELKFYIFFGIIYFIFKNLNKAIIVWGIFSIILNLLLIFTEKVVFFSSISPHANLFLIGLMVFNLKGKNFISYFLISLIALTNIFINERYSDYEIYFLFLILITILILKININLKFNLLSRIGLISFSWYLLHNAIGIIIIREFNKMGFENYSIIIAILTTLVFAIISFKFIEVPLKKIIINNYKFHSKKFS